MSTPAASPNRERIDTLVGLMAAAAIFLGVLGATDLHLSLSGQDIQMRPVRIGVGAIVLALIAAGIGGRHKKLAAVAVGIAGAGWLIGMIIGVVAQKPLF